MNNKALILIETQNEWMADDGKLRNLIEDEVMFNQSKKNIEKVLAYARAKNSPVVHVGLTFNQGYPEMGDGKLGLRNAIPKAETFPANGEGSNFYDPLKPHENEFVVSGRIGSSSFSGSNLDTYLRNNNINTLYLTGYAMHVCVESTLREAHDKGYNTILISDASAAFNSDQKDHVLDHVIHHFGTHMTADEYLKDKVVA